VASTRLILPRSPKTLPLPFSGRLLQEVGVLQGVGAVGLEGVGLDFVGRPRLRPLQRLPVRLPHQVAEVPLVVELDQGVGLLQALRARELLEEVALFLAEPLLPDPEGVAELLLFLPLLQRFEEGALLQAEELRQDPREGLEGRGLAHGHGVGLLPVRDHPDRPVRPGHPAVELVQEGLEVAPAGFRLLGRDGRVVGLLPWPVLGDEVNPVGGLRPPEGEGLPVDEPLGPPVSDARGEVLHAGGLVELDLDGLFSYLDLHLFSEGGGGLGPPPLPPNCQSSTRTTLAQEGVGQLSGGSPTRATTTLAPGLGCFSGHGV